MDEKVTLGLTEDVVIVLDDGEHTVHARIDTGATKSSIDQDLADELKLGPIVDTIAIRSANGRMERPAINVEGSIIGKKFSNVFTIADRSHMKFKMLIGQDVLKQGFLIDPNKYDEPSEDVEED